MPHDVFISCTSSDQHFSDAACAILERSGFLCWLAPRDIYPGQTWEAAADEAINGSKIFVLILSEQSNQSAQLLREVERAVNCGIPVLPVRIENIVLARGIEDLISPFPSLNAVAVPLEDQLHSLVRAVSRLTHPPEKGPSSNFSDLIIPGTRK